MELHELLRKAYEEVEKADLPERYQLKAYEKSIDLLTRNTKPTKNPKFGTVSGPIVESQPSENGTVISKIATQLKIRPDILEEVYYKDEDDLEIILGSSKLDESYAGATQEIALLTAGGRQLGELEEWTSANIIREKCEFHGKYDYSNFAKTIKKMDNVFSFKGTGQSREVRIIRPGIEALKDLILQKTGRSN